ncbi:MAG: 30S ribosomal protein S9 [Candidatus Neomarinimicrobiota bacterium]|nr:MAG: 30S ribosomal protein S9 [Candidatus Neomarinimicrobiota bacterium]
MAEYECIATGRRKTSVARLRMAPGKGKFLVNGKPLEVYFPRLAHREDIVRPLKVCDMLGKFDIKVRVEGGGISGQAGAVRLAVARALEKYDPDLRKILKPAGLLSRDPRVKERKKYGLRGARRAFQFSKR